MLKPDEQVREALRARDPEKIQAAAYRLIRLAGALAHEDLGPDCRDVDCPVCAGTGA